MVTSGWTTLVDAAAAVGDMAWAWDLDFLLPLVREAEGSLILDLVLDDVNVQNDMGLNLQGTVAADSMAHMCVTGEYDSPRFIRMDGDDRMEIDPMSLVGLDTTITVECWLRGNEDVLPVNTTLFEATNDANQRELNVHVPWSNSRVYWDCGHDGGYDRIDEARRQASWRVDGFIGRLSKMRRLE